VPGEQDLVARLTAQWKPTNQFTLTLKGSADRYRVTDATWNDELISCPTGSAQVNPGEICNKNWKIQQNDVPADIAATNPLLGRHGGKLYQDYDSYGLTANADYSTSLVDLSAVTGFHHFVNYFLGDYDFTGAANGGTWGAERSEYQAFSEEVRAQTHLSSPLNFMAGAYYQTTKMRYRPVAALHHAGETIAHRRPDPRRVRPGDLEVEPAARGHGGRALHPRDQGLGVRPALCGHPLSRRIHPELAAGCRSNLRQPLAGSDADLAADLRLDGLWGL
jgi:hypothetical protein